MVKISLMETVYYFIPLLHRSTMYISDYSSEKSWELYSGESVQFGLEFPKSQLALSHILPLTNKTNVPLSTVGGAALDGNYLLALCIRNILKY